MDPDANLEEQRRIVERACGDEFLADSDDLLRLAELVQALDEWLSKGNFLPVAWKFPDRLAAK